MIRRHRGSLANLSALALGAICLLHCGGKPVGELRVGEETAAAPTAEETPEALPIQGRMAAWSAAYRKEMALVAKSVEVFERNADSARSDCNNLLIATYNAKSELPPSSDPDIEEMLQKGLEHFASAGTFCLQQNAGLRDTMLLLGKSSITLVEKLLAERYAESGVPGLAEPMTEGSEAGRRAVEYATSLKAETEPPSAQACLRAETSNFNITSRHQNTMRVAWPIHISNSCAQPLRVRVTLTLFDKYDFQLITSSTYADVPPRGSGDTIVTMTVNNDQAARIAKHSTQLSLQ